MRKIYAILIYILAGRLAWGTAWGKAVAGLNAWKCKRNPFRVFKYAIAARNKTAIENFKNGWSSWDSKKWYSL